jgi:prevent-host-death family protein
MTTVSVAEAKAHLSALLAKVEAGEDVVITRHGRPIAHVSAVSQPKIPLASLAEFRASMQGWSAPSSDLLRQARDDDR